MEDESFVSIMNMPEDAGITTFFWGLYQNREYTDVEFDLLGPEGPVNFEAHKIVLSIWSPYFSDHFYTGNEMRKRNTSTTLQFSDVNPEAFEAMLRFMYGNMPELQSDKKACELYKIATRFQVASLKDSCRGYVNDVHIEPSNVFDILDASEYMENRGRIDTCLNMLQENTAEVMEAFKFSGISVSMLHTLLDLPSLSLPGEFELLTWVFAWGKNNAENHKSVSTRKALEPFMKKLNFLALTDAEFTNILLTHESFFTKDEIITIFMNIAKRGSKQMPEWYNESGPIREYGR